MRSIRRSLILVGLAFLVGFILLGQSTSNPARAQSGFVTRCGIHFCLNGNLYYYAGANAYEIFTFGSGSGDEETQWMDKTAIDNIFTQMQNNHVTVVRTWMFDHQAWHGFEPAKGVYSDQQFGEFDYEIQSAAAHGIKLIAVLENNWADYGGIDQRLAWEGVSNGDANRWQFFKSSACPGCFTQYKN